MEKYKKLKLYTHPNFGASITVHYMDGSVKCYADRNPSERQEFARLLAIYEKKQKDKLI